MMEHYHVWLILKGLGWVALFFAVLVLWAWLSDAGMEVREENHESMTSNRLHGKYRVHYPDGAVSQPMYYCTAKTYQNLYGGTIVKFR